MTNEVVVHLGVPKQRVERFIDVPGTLGHAGRVLKHNTKTVYFTPTKILVKLAKFDNEPVELLKVILSDSAGNQAFVEPHEWEDEHVPDWLKITVGNLLARDYERDAPSAALEPMEE